MTGTWRGFDHPPRPSAEVKEWYSCTSSPPPHRACVACYRATFTYSRYVFGSGVRTDSVVHGFYIGAKAAGVWSWPLTSI